MSEEAKEEGSGDVHKKCTNLRFPITVEPLILLYTLSVGLNEVIRSNLIIEKICQVRNYSTESQRYSWILRETHGSYSGET